MEKDFVPYEVALRLKAIGFAESCCFGYWEIAEKERIRINGYSIGNWNNHPNRASAPLYQQAFRWFREKHNLRGFIGFRPNTKQFDCHIYDMSLSAEEYVIQRTLAEFNKDPKVGTYEEAETACLEKLIEIVESKSE